MGFAGGLELRTVRDRDELRCAWGVLGRVYDPPLSDSVDDYGAYLDKVAKNAVSLLAIENESVLGGVSFYANDDESRSAFVTQVMVLPEAQGQGIGTLLLEACEEESRRRGMESIKLEVRFDNKGARRLYERMGYRQVGKTRSGALMEKSLRLACS